MDWNWFFSSLAQATAAITGIFAAFIITKIINLQSEFKRKETRMKELLVASENYRDALKNQRWKWYCDKKLELALKKIDVLLADGVPLTPQQILHQVKFPKFVCLEEILLRINERIETVNAARIPTDEEIYTQLVDTNDVVPSADDDILAILKDEKARIDASILKTRRHIRRAKLHLEEIGLDRDEFRLIQQSILVAGLLFIFGVTLPLSFLRISNGTSEMLDLSDWLASLISLKGGLILVVTAIFLYILVIFWRASQRLEFKEQDIAALRDDTVLTNYSPYLAVKVENKKKLVLLMDGAKTAGRPIDRLDQTHIRQPAN